MRKDEREHVKEIAKDARGLRNEIETRQVERLRCTVDMREKAQALVDKVEELLAKR